MHLGGKHVITSATVAGTRVSDSFIFLLSRRQNFPTIKTDRRRTSISVLIETEM